jgi:hypothetical protein
MFIKRFICVSISILFISGCSQKAAQISPVYTSPLIYQHYSCEQIRQELFRVKNKVMEISGQQDATASKDAVALGVGLVIFWPALFFMMGGEKKHELGRLKGEYEALEKCAIEKECNINNKPYVSNKPYISDKNIFISTAQPEIKIKFADKTPFVKKIKLEEHTPYKNNKGNNDIAHHTTEIYIFHDHIGTYISGVILSDIHDKNSVFLPYKKNMTPGVIKHDNVIINGFEYDRVIGINSLPVTKVQYAEIMQDLKKQPSFNIPDYVIVQFHRRIIGSKQKRVFIFLNTKKISKDLLPWNKTKPLTQNQIQFLKEFEKDSKTAIEIL